MSVGERAGDVRIAVGDGGAVRTITLCRPEKRNALTHEMFSTLTDAFTREPKSQERVTVLRAEGPVFCSGVDLRQRSEGSLEESRSPLELLCSAVWRYPLPVVAVLSGAAIGGGFMLVAHCDFVVAVEDAKVGNSAVQLGLVPPWPLSRQVETAARSALARRLLLMGDLEPATRLGAVMITAAVPAEVVEGELDRLLKRLTQNAPLSMRAIKATLNAELYVPASHREVVALIHRAQESDDSKEGVLARRERREPRFLGR
ncbi:MAG: enoyl-CoA hydratase/isomerase family protein [Actinomycetota bacterium]